MVPDFATATIRINESKREVVQRYTEFHEAISRLERQI